MYLTEEDEYAFCAACKGEVFLADRVCRLGGDDVLCFDCATERCGIYEEVLDRWTVQPNVDDLAPASLDPV